MVSSNLLSFLQTAEGEKYFNEVSAVTSKIREYLENLKNYPGAFMSKQNSLKLIENNPETTIRLYMFLDAVKCYKRMDLDFESDSIDSIALSLFANSVLGLQLWSFDSSLKTWLSRRQNIKIFTQTILNKYGHLDSVDGCPQVYNALQSSNIERANKYLILLTAWAEMAARYNKKNRSKSYCQYLSQLSSQESSSRLSAVSTVSSEQPTRESLEQHPVIADPIAELNSLVGLYSVKKEINSFVNFIRVQQARQISGMKTSPISYHCIFAGNPGTGKTTVARIMASIYKELGIVKEGQLVETDRSGLVAEYVGQTAVKTNKIIDKAIGGVLFIDEAYALSQGGGTDFGKEAIATLIKRMEDDRGRLIVILAGYSDNMTKFLDANPGLQSRFSQVFTFSDYTEEELIKIFYGLIQKYEYQMTPKGDEALSTVIHDAYLKRGKNFGNARFVRNLFEQVIKNQADRIASESSFTPEMLRTISETDFQS